MRQLKFKPLPVNLSGLAVDAAATAVVAATAATALLVLLLLAVIVSDTDAIVAIFHCY